MSGPRATPERDQEASPFSDILVQLCRATGARCAALVDAEGETVDYGGTGDPFDIRILAAEWRLVLSHLQLSGKLGVIEHLMVRARNKSFWVEALPLGYALVVQMGRRAASLSPRALGQAKRDLCHEAGFSLARPSESWVRVVVEEEAGTSRRPVAMSLEEEELYVTVLGRVRSQAKHEAGYRVRLSTGEERTLVREPLGHWYLEEERWA